jgi:hypothetical protein
MRYSEPEAWGQILHDQREQNVAAATREYREYLEARNARVASFKPLGEDDVASGLLNKFMIGTDPEFVVLDNDGVVVNTDGTLPHTGVVGWDHGGQVVEIRPEPAHGVYALTKRLQKEIMSNEALATLAKYKWRAGALIRARVARADTMTNARGERTLTLGGHVHIDQPPDPEGEEHQLRLSSLDRVTQWLEELDILPQKESAARREDPTARRNGYGKFGDWRSAGGRDGQPPRMEYRTMASWLFDPKVTFLALTMAKLAAAVPQVTLDKLKKGACSYSALRDYLENFRFRDTNARRALEKLFEGHNVKYLQIDPTENFRPRWKELGL